MVWSLTGRGRRGADLDENGYVAQTPLSRFAPKHRRPAPRQADGPDVAVDAPVLDDAPVPERDAPATPLNQLMYHGDVAPQGLSAEVRPQAAPQDAAPAQAPSEPEGMQPAHSYLTGLEEEPPIPVSILKRALPDRF